MITADTKEKPPMPVREKLLCTLAEAEQLTSLSGKTIHRLIAENKFPKNVDAGRADMIRFRVKDLLEWSEGLRNS